MCDDCLAARETSGHWRMYDLKCIYCGARLIQKIGRLQIPRVVATQRRMAVLADWVAFGHSEAEIRGLVSGRMALTPIVRERK
jgi:hypothetical protein